MALRPAWNEVVPNGWYSSTLISAPLPSSSATELPRWSASWWRTSGVGWATGAPPSTVTVSTIATRSSAAITCTTSRAAVVSPPAPAPDRADQLEPVDHDALDA